MHWHQPAATGIGTASSSWLSFVKCNSSCSRASAPVAAHLPVHVNRSGDPVRAFAIARVLVADPAVPGAVSAAADWHVLSQIVGGGAQLTKILLCLCE